jgi:hypothetical protein
MTQIGKRKRRRGMASARRLTTGPAPSPQVPVGVLCCPGAGVSGFGFSEEGISI